LWKTIQLKENINTFIRVAGRLTELFTKSIYPDVCVICGVASECAVCSECLEGVERFQRPVCLYCGLKSAQNVLRCDWCSNNNSLYFNKCRSYGPYGGRLKKIIHFLKYGGVRVAGGGLADLLFDLFIREFTDDGIDLIAFVPMHDLKYRERTFDHSFLLAWEFSKKAELPLFTGVFRTKMTVSQTKINDEMGRFHNIKDVFEIRDRSKVRDKRILLVDDVFTTGATSSECSKALINAGCSSVSVLTVARTVPHNENREV